MVEIVVKRLFVLSAHSKGKKIANDIRNTKIEGRFNGSTGCYAEEMNKTIDILNALFQDIANKLDETNESIAHISDDFNAMDELIAATFEVTTPKE